jgi:hypothetical protein
MFHLTAKISDSPKWPVGKTENGPLVKKGRFPKTTKERRLAIYELWCDGPTKLT